MSALNTVAPTPMPAAVNPGTPAQATQSAKSEDAASGSGQPANFANTLDAKVKANQAADAKPDSKDADAQAATDDPAQLAQIAAALLATLGAAPVADKTAPATTTDAQDQALQGVGANGVPGTGLPVDGNALPTTAVTAVATPTAAAPTLPANGAATNQTDLALANAKSRTTAAQDGALPGAAMSAATKAAASDAEKDVSKLGLSAEKSRVIDVAAQETAPTQPSISPWDTSNTRTAEAARTNAPQFTVPTPVTSKAWADDVGNRMVWMAGKELGRAELVLTPPHLGRVEITLNVSGDQTSASFVTATPAARDAIEQSLPRLREMMADAGLSLGQVNVSANNTKDPSQEQKNWGGASRSSSDRASQDDGEVALVHSRPIWSAGRGAIDTFA